MKFIEQPMPEVINSCNMFKPFCPIRYYPISPLV